ncbi:MAG TPA: CHAT domain-containing tetratricopeptide repeat protein [Myxococcaceae bacterium]|nr:CHAT domain-containing tetratricopeptide repeat protein [Myxococcaceae bacterium]
MTRAVSMTILLLLWGAGCATVAKAPVDARLAEAQRAMEEGKKLLGAGRYAEAVPLAERALALREEVLGGAHPQVADSLELLGDLQGEQAEHARAEPLLQRALAIREAALGASHPDVGSSLVSLARLHRNQGHLQQARALLERTLVIWERAFGKDHPEVARVLNNLGVINVEQGLYEEAEPLYLRALAIREVAVGKDHPRVASTLHNLADLYFEQGLHSKAKALYERSLTIEESMLGGKHPQVAISLSNLASVHAEQGFYTRASPLLERALAIAEAAYGGDHPVVASSLSNLAALYKKQGLYARALPLYERAVSILEASLGQDHLDTMIPLMGLAGLYVEQGLYSRAGALYERILTVREAAQGENHPDIAILLHNLAGLYANQGLDARALPLLQRALAIREEVLGGEHPLLAASLNNLAELHANQEEYERAELLQRRALDIQRRSLGNAHPDTVMSFNNLAELELARQRFPQALPLFEEAFTHSEEFLRREVLTFSEERLAGFLKTFRAQEERIYALLRARPGDARLRGLAMATALLRKGRSVEELAQTSRAIYRGLGSEGLDILERLRALRTLRARLALAGPGPSSQEEHERRLAALGAQEDALEADLGRRSARLRALNVLPPPAQIVERVREALPREGALVEFIAYEERGLTQASGESGRKGSAEARYLALVLFADGRGSTLDLGPAAPIDSAASRLRDMLARHATGHEAVAQALYRSVFAPLVPVLGRTRRLFLSPDGQLSLIPFDALHDGKRFLVDTFDFTYLDSGKDLLPRPEGLAPTRSVVVLADPDFGASPDVSSASAVAERSPSVEQFFSTLREDVADSPWVPLPGTRQEAEAIQRLLPQARLLLGREATKEALLQLRAPGLLHVATHGFFLEDAAVPRSSRGVGSFGAVAQEGPVAHLADPLLRSGLVLAGARAPAAGSGSPHLGDSLVTALELSGMDLWGTQLVVLSACDTGRGVLKPGQGVYGLRRALGVAGAETVVMSLWKVNDETTRALMEDYYLHLRAGEGRLAALRKAMKALRGKRPHPHFWAPFIAVGKDGPLREIAPAPRPRPSESSQDLPESQTRLRSPRLDESKNVYQRHARTIFMGVGQQRP